MGGGAFGGLLSQYGADQQARKQAEIMQNAINGISPQLMQSYQTAMGYQQPYMQAGQQAMGQYQGLLSSFDPNQYVAPDMGEFQYGQSVEDFLAPGSQYEIDQAMQGILGQSASAGLARSGGALKAMQDRGQQIAGQRYGEARNAMQNDRAQLFNQFTSRAQMLQQNAQQRLSALQSQLGGLSNIAGMGQQSAGNMGNLATGQGETMANLAMTRANAQAQGVGTGWQGYLGAGLQGLGQLGSFYAGQK
jgi:hypothetical protein